MTRADGAITFWESLSGEQYALDGPAGFPYLTLACVFSHRSAARPPRAARHLRARPALFFLRPIVPLFFGLRLD